MGDLDCIGGVLLAELLELTDAERLLLLLLLIPFVEELLLKLTEFSLLDEDIIWLWWLFVGGDTEPSILPCEEGR